VSLLHSAQSLLASLLELVRTRIELFSSELHEELARLAVALLGALVAVVLAAFGVGFAALALVIAVGEERRLATVGILAVIFFALGALAAWSVARVVRAKPRVFDASLKELQRDYEAFEP